MISFLLYVLHSKHAVQPVIPELVLQPRVVAYVNDYGKGKVHLHVIIAPTMQYLSDNKLRVLFRELFINLTCIITY